MDEKKWEKMEELLREADEDQRKLIEAVLETKTLVRRGTDLLTVIDWNDGPEELLKNGISVTDLFGRKIWSLVNQSHCLVRNFPALEVPDAHLSHCVFENCGDITIADGTAVHCTFSKVNSIFLDHVKVYDSVFQDLHCDYGGLIIGMEDSTISGSEFKDIRLEDDNYLADGVGDCLIEKCRFKRITTEREDGELFTCSKTVGQLFKKQVTYDMVDRLSCNGAKNLFE